MTEREEKLNFMVTYLEDNEYDDPWKAVAVLDLYKAYFDEDTPEEEIQKILEKITVDEWDDGEITFEMCNAAINQNLYAMKYVPERFRRESIQNMEDWQEYDLVKIRETKRLRDV